MAGRRVQLTTDIQTKILQAVRAGNHLETAAAYAGVDEHTLFDWLRRGAKERTGPHRELSQALDKAMAEAEVRDVAIIAKAAERDWRAAAWRLEHRWPHRWARKEPERST